MESKGVRKIQHLVQVKVISVSHHIAVAIHVTDVAAVVAVDAVVRITKVAFLGKPSDHADLSLSSSFKLPERSFPTNVTDVLYHLTSNIFFLFLGGGGLPITGHPITIFGLPFSIKGPFLVPLTF